MTETTTAPMSEQEAKYRLVLKLIENTLANPYDVQQLGWDAGFEEDGAQEYATNILHEMIDEINETGAIDLAEE